MLLSDAIAYRDGKLFWKIKPSQGVEIGEEAGGLDAYGYMCFKFKGKTYKTHRVVWYLHYGEWPTGLIDHKNQVKNDNRISNLRDCTKSVNLRNQTKAQANSKSGIRGVYFETKSKKWVAQITVNNNQIRLGEFSTIEAATQVRKTAEQQYNFHPK